MGLLDKCYKEEDQLTSQLLTYDLVNWSHWTCLTLAVSANLKDFLSHAACQLLINDLWMGGMKIRKHVIPKIIAALLFPPALFAIQFKSAKELQYMPQTQEEHEQDLEEQEEDEDSDSESPGDKTSDRLAIDDDDADPTAQHPPNPNQLLYQRFGELIKDNKSKEDADRLLPAVNFLNSEQSLDGGGETEMQQNARNYLNYDQLIEMYDLKHKQPTTSKLTRRESQKSSGGGGGGKKEGGKRRLLSTVREETAHLKERMLDRRRTVNFIVKNRANKLKFGKKIYEFYNAPITKYWQNTIIYILFLISFAYIVLVKTPSKIYLPEIFVIVYIFSYGFDKIREVCVFWIF